MKDMSTTGREMGIAENENRTLLVRSASTALRSQCLYPLGNANANVTLKREFAYKGSKKY